MAISRRAVFSFIDRELDSFTWMKKLTRETIMRELGTLRVKPHFKTTPWLHQLVCFYIALCNPRFLFLLDMGLGKTKIIADVITQLLRERRLTRCLVTVPRLVNVDSWVDDLERHSDLGYQRVDCEDIEEKRERLLFPPKEADVTLIDYAGLHLAMCDRVKGGKGKGKLVKNEAAVRRMQRIYNFVGIDESHKLANPDSLWFSIMRQATKEAEFTYATTGTLFGKRVMDIWPQFFLVDHGDTFGENMGLFRAAFFEEKNNGWKNEYHFIKRMDRKLHSMLQHRSIRYAEDEVPEVDVPKRREVARRLNMTEEQREAYNLALEGIINAGGDLRQLDGQWTRMRQICSGYQAWKDDNGDHVLRFRKNPKLEDMETLLEEMLPHSKVVIAYDYTETGCMVSERLKELDIDHEWFWGGSKNHGAQRRRFMEDDACRVFLMNSSAGGEGTDGLQKVARFLIMYESPTSPTLRQQTIKRVHRAGQQHRAFIYDLVMRRSLEKGILDAIAEGIDIHDRVVSGKKVASRGFFLSD
jgi:superfamily II DNA or RNA helicase